VRQVERSAVVHVADEGPGLDAEQVAHVFDRFYRGSEARTGEGTGLGLSIVAALAAAHGGSARVESTPGVGSVFIVEIPVADPEVAASAPGAEAEPDPGGDTSPTAPGGGDEHLAPSVRR
jgi:signal transduction histidine kinase